MGASATPKRIERGGEEGWASRSRRGNPFLWSGPNGIAERVPDEYSPGDSTTAKQVATVWKNRRNTRANVIAAHERAMPDFHASDVGDRIQRAGRQRTHYRPGSLARRRGMSTLFY